MRYHVVAMVDLLIDLRHRSELLEIQNFNRGTLESYWNCEHQHFGVFIFFFFFFFEASKRSVLKLTLEFFLYSIIFVWSPHVEEKGGAIIKNIHVRTGKIWRQIGMALQPTEKLCCYKETLWYYILLLPCAEDNIHWIMLSRFTKRIYTESIINRLPNSSVSACLRNTRS